MTNREYNAVAGRFMTIERAEDYVVVGLLGSLWKDDLTGNQLRHIKTFWIIKLNIVYLLDLIII